MAIERIYYCDGPECECHARTAGPGIPTGFLRVTGDRRPLHFHGWDCALRYAAKFEPAEIIPAGSMFSDGD